MSDEMINTQVQEEIVNIVNLLDEELKENKSLSNFKDVNDLARSYVNLNKLLGKRFAELDSDEANLLMNKYGVPNDVAEYEVDGDDDVKEHVLQMAGDLKLTKDQAKKLAEKLQGNKKEKLTASAAKAKDIHDSQVKRLQEIYGDFYEEKVGAVKESLLKFGGETLLKKLEQANLQHDPDLVQAINKLVINLHEDRIVKTEQKSTFVSAEEADHQFKQILANPEKMKAWKDPMHPNHKNVQAEVRKIIDAKNRSR